MKDKNPFFSLVVTFRNRNVAKYREINRIKRHLDSLKKQNYQNFELIFVNSGSDEDITEQLEDLLLQYSFVNYIYLETRGWDWNKYYALNVGVVSSQNDWIVINDIDMLYPQNFLETVSKVWKRNEVLVYRFYYLPENFTDYASLEQNANKFATQLESSQYTASGTIIFPRKVFDITTGFDEFYRGWGLGDIDFLKMVEENGYNYSFWDENRIPVFHQWHEKTGTPFFKNFYTVAQKHFDAKRLQKAKNKHLLEKTKAGKVVNVSDRPTLQKVLNNNIANSLQFQFDTPKDNAFLLFLQTFEELESGEYLLVQQEFAEFSSHKSRLKNIVKFVNKVLKKIKISYRFVELAKFEDNKLEWKDIKNFLRYFTVHFSAYMEDYYFECEYPKVFLLLLKK